MGSECFKSVDLREALHKPQQLGVFPQMQMLELRMRVTVKLGTEKRGQKRKTEIIIAKLGNLNLLETESELPWTD